MDLTISDDQEDIVGLLLHSCLDVGNKLSDDMAEICRATKSNILFRYVLLIRYTLNKLWLLPRVMICRLERYPQLYKFQDSDNFH
jgi:hypothetical protein